MVVRKWLYVVEGEFLSIFLIAFSLSDPVAEFGKQFFRLVVVVASPELAEESGLELVGAPEEEDGGGVACGNVVYRKSFWFTLNPTNKPNPLQLLHINW